MVMPLVDGIQFFKLLRKFRYFEENVAAFFAGQMVLALEYLHYMGIVFRDLKPENILMDIKGYLKLIDFGFAKRIGDGYTYTLCGTPEYMAPEILLGKGYRTSPDWWSLGILIYEMCNATPPFTSKNHLVIYEKILCGLVKWPRHFSLELKALLRGLIQVNTSKRLGCQKGKAQDIKYHKWFASTDWFALWHKKILPPISLVNLDHDDSAPADLTSIKTCNTTLHLRTDNIDASI